MDSTTGKRNKDKAKTKLPRNIGMVCKDRQLLHRLFP